MEQQNESENQSITPVDSNEPQTIEATCAAGCGATVRTIRFRAFNVFVTPPQKCAACIEKKEQEKREAARKARDARIDAAWERICPPLYRDTQEDRLPTDKFEQVMAWEYGPKGLLLIGESGLGKTRCAYRLLHRLLHEDRTIRAFDATQFGYECAHHFGVGTGARWISGLCAADVVFLDDLAKVKMTERVEAELFGLVERRAAFLRPIIITTNYTGAVLMRKMSEGTGPALTRRLREFCGVINFGNGAGPGEVRL